MHFINSKIVATCHFFLIKLFEIPNLNLAKCLEISLVRMGFRNQSSHCNSVKIKVRDIFLSE